MLVSHQSYLELVDIFTLYALDEQALSTWVDLVDEVGLGRSTGRTARWVIDLRPCNNPSRDTSIDKLYTSSNTNTHLGTEIWAAILTDDALTFDAMRSRIQAIYALPMRAKWFNNQADRDAALDWVLDN